MLLAGDALFAYECSDCGVSFGLAHVRRMRAAP
jgi:hypothetical protein